MAKVCNECGRSFMPTTSRRSSAKNLENSSLVKTMAHKVGIGVSGGGGHDRVIGTKQFSLTRMARRN